MTIPFDTLAASVEIVSDLNETRHPGPNGASLSAILGAAIFETTLNNSGFAIVPLTPNSDMEKAFKTGSFTAFADRYAALIEASKPK